jgi:hypothetical protein
LSIVDIEQHCPLSIALASDQYRETAASASTQRGCNTTKHKMATIDDLISSLNGGVHVSQEGYDLQALQVS